ncbi:reverse transcriptase [Elysia marginata]|uniref:Reverse transcriptase n=1 Tax=Elysia marginata TaxID=1093978 RepID=A0AAV4JP95_9GAST|nr:reverse transcriptase [Elysia marginata]
MKDTRRVVKIVQFASEGLLVINKCGLQSKFKVWCLQSMLIPKLLWLLLVYDIFCSTVESIEAKIHKYTRKWLRVSPELRDMAMYCRNAKLKLPMKSILEEYKCGKVRLVTMLEDSDDSVVKTVQPFIVKRWSKTEGKEKRDMIINEVRQREDFKRVQKAVQQRQQGHWDSAIQRSLTW